MSEERAHPIIDPSNYRALDPAKKDIRVLEVAPGKAGDVIRCTLRHVSLLGEPAPVYETISYCWGAPGEPAYLELNGELVAVPASSEATIRRLRYTDRPRVLWLDAICISQSSVADRSEQVALMPDVYGKGERNLIYLGEDDDTMAARAQRCIEQVLAEMRDATDDFRKLDNIMANKGHDGVRTCRSGFDHDVDFDVLECLFERPWFRSVARLYVLETER